MSKRSARVRNGLPKQRSANRSILDAFARSVASAPGAACVLGRVAPGRSVVTKIGSLATRRCSHLSVIPALFFVEGAVGMIGPVIFHHFSVGILCDGGWAKWPPALGTPAIAAAVSAPWRLVRGVDSDCRSAFAQNCRGRFGHRGRVGRSARFAKPSMRGYGSLSRAASAREGRPRPGCPWRPILIAEE